jgi:hypothetical protein
MGILTKIVIGMLTKVLGPITGYKTVIGILMGIALEAARYFDIAPAQLDSSVLDVVWQTLTAVGIGHKMGK